MGAVVQCLVDWRRVDQSMRSASRLNVLSVGDGEAERWALKALRGPWVKRALSTTKFPLCKTVKLMNYPSVDQLSHELSSVVSNLQLMVSSSKRFDLNASSPAELSRKLHNMIV